MYEGTIASCQLHDWRREVVIDLSDVRWRYGSVLELLPGERTMYKDSVCSVVQINPETGVAASQPLRTRLQVTCVQPIEHETCQAIVEQLALRYHRQEASAFANWLQMTTQVAIDQSDFDWTVPFGWGREQEPRKHDVVWGNLRTGLVLVILVGLLLYMH